MEVVAAIRSAVNEVPWYHIVYSRPVVMGQGFGGWRQSSGCVAVVHNAR